MKLILIAILIIKFSFGIWLLRHRIRRVIVKGRNSQKSMDVSFELFMFYRASVGL